MNVKIQMLSLWVVIIFNQVHWWTWLFAGIGLFLALDDIVNN